MRNYIVGIAALLLSACGGETYQVAPTEAFMSLSGIGTTGIDPLPGGLSPVSVSFESVPGDNTVQWQFSHEGDDLAKIVARVTPDGDAASTVTVEYVAGQSPDDKWRNAQARRLIQNQIQRLVVEAVDSTLDKREFNQSLRHDVIAQVTMASASAVMGDVSDAMDKEIARRKEASSQSGSTAGNTYAATKPSADLSKYNN